ncbi:NADH dehydrogenase subunit G [Rhodobacterales bacterium HTCC2150]|nr:NADH dehydrogenase subunit G [Rhodobacterales bacterium HTCC2150] [Rhodobacteraceae bacterium HTCC2150]
MIVFVFLILLPSEQQIMGENLA